MSEQIIYFDGKMMPLSEARVPVMDHAVLYGDGAFEGIREYSRQVFKLDEHITRFYNSLRAIGIQVKLSKKEMQQVVVDTCAVNKYEDCYIRLLVTRGGDCLGLLPNPQFPPRVICIAGPLSIYTDEAYEKGLHAKTSSFRRNKATIVDPQIKSLNYLNNIQALLEAKSFGCEEAVLLNEDGVICECSGDNLFIVNNNVVYTPPVWLGTLDGITRRNVIRVLKKAGYEVREDPFTLFNLYAADEAFLTGTAAEAIALTEVDGRVIGSGTAGKVTKEVLKLFREYVKDPANGTPVEF